MHAPFLPYTPSFPQLERRVPLGDNPDRQVRFCVSFGGPAIGPTRKGRKTLDDSSGPRVCLEPVSLPPERHNPRDLDECQRHGVFRHISSLLFFVVIVVRVPSSAPAPSGWLTVSGCQTVGKADPVARLVCHLSVSTARTYPRTPGLGRAFSLRMTCFDRVDSLEQRRLRTSPRAHAAPFCKVSRLALLLPSDCTPPSKAGKTTLEHEFQARPFTAANSFRHTCVPRVCSSRGGVGG